jgi:hypothetical protein
LGIIVMMSKPHKQPGAIAQRLGNASLGANPDEAVSARKRRVLLQGFGTHSQHMDNQWREPPLTRRIERIASCDAPAHFLPSPAGQFFGFLLRDGKGHA